MNDSAFKEFVIKEEQLKALEGDNAMLQMQFDGYEKNYLDLEREAHDKKLIWFLGGVILGAAASFSATR